MNLARRPVNEERACGAALGGSACRSPRTRDDAPLQRRCPARSEQNTSSIFSPGTEKGWLGSAWLGLAWPGPPLLAVSAALSCARLHLLQMWRSRLRGVMNCVVCAL